MSLKDEFRQDLPREDELIATDRRIAVKAAVDDTHGICPTNAQWVFFVAGRFNETRAAGLAEHLAECESCTATLAEIRSGQRASGRRFSRNKLVFAAIAAVVLVVALLAAWLMRGWPPSETAIADLRNVTRGIDNTSRDSGVTLHRKTRLLRILLVPQQVEGKYEIAVFSPTDLSSPVLTRSASSTRETDSLVLEVPVIVSNLQPGPYLLGIRHDNSQWVYYAIRIE